MALPGVQTVLLDRFYALSRTDVPTGPRVLAIGTRNTANGTGGVVDFDPYTATNEQHVIAAYGSGSQLHRAYLELLAGGASMILLVALPMGTTDANLADTSTGNPFDAAFGAAEQAQPDIIVPWGRGGHPADWTAPGATPGAAGASASPYTIQPFGFYADSSSSAVGSMVNRVARAVAGITSRSNPCMAVMGVKPYVGSGAFATENVVASELVSYLNFPNLPLISDTGMGNFGPYVSVVATEMRPVSYPFDKATSYYDWGYSNGACAYAAQASTMASWNSLTGQTAVNVSGLRWSATRTQQDVNIAQRGMVPLGLNFQRIPNWIDSPTFAAPGSDYARLSTLRIIFDAVQLVRQISQQYIGQGATLHLKNAFETSISSGLRGMIQLGALTTADFTVTYLPQQNEADVALILTPAFEIRTIVISVSINL